jgi:TPR repeat protein
LKQVVAECERQWFEQTLKAAKAGETAMQTLVGQMLCSGYGASVNVKEVQCSSSQPLHSSFSFVCVCVCVCVCCVCVLGRAKMYVVHCIMCAYVCLQSLLLLLLKQQSRRGKDWFGKHQGILWLQKAAEKDQEAQNLLASLSCTHPNLVIFYAFHLHLHACVLFAYLYIFKLLCWG